MQLYIASSTDFSDTSYFGGAVAESASTGSAVFWLAVALLVAVASTCGLVAGFVAWRGGANPFNAALAGFKAFGVVVGLGISFLALAMTLPRPATSAAQDLPGAHSQPPDAPGDTELFQIR